MPENTGCFGREDGAGVVQRTAERSGVERGVAGVAGVERGWWIGDCVWGSGSGVMSP